MMNCNPVARYYCNNYLRYCQTLSNATKPDTVASDAVARPGSLRSHVTFLLRCRPNFETAPVPTAF